MSSNYEVSLEVDLIWRHLTQNRQTTAAIVCQMLAFVHEIYQTLVYGTSTKSAYVPP